MTQRLLAGALLAFAAASAGFADHHGRGREQLNGFPGIYVHPQITLTFTGDGYLITTVNASNVAAAVQSYSVADGVLTVQDVSPPAFYPEAVAACARTNAATYRIEHIEGGIHLAALDEPCPPRGDLLSRFDFADYVRPEPADE